MLGKINSQKYKKENVFDEFSGLWIDNSSMSVQDIVK